jgi:hypothetical protein
MPAERTTRKRRRDEVPGTGPAAHRHEWRSRSCACHEAGERIRVEAADRIGPSAASSDPAAAGNALADKFRDLRSDPNGSDPASDGGEMGMYSLHRMVTDRLTAPENAGFMRSDAALAVIFLSDENDICAYPPLTSPSQTVPPDHRKFDPEGAEAAEYARSCPGTIKPDGSNVLAELVALEAGQPVFVGGILYNNLGDGNGRYARLTDPSVEDEQGHGYLDMIQLAGGTSVDLALSTIDVAAFDEAIATLGHAVAVQPIHLVQLDHAPLAPQTIHQYNLPSHTPVSPDPADYDPDTQLVTLHDPGAPAASCRSTTARSHPRATTSTTSASRTPARSRARCPTSTPRPS